MQPECIPLTHANVDDVSVPLFVRVDMVPTYLGDPTNGITNTSKRGYAQRIAKALARTHERMAHKNMCQRR